VGKKQNAIYEQLLASIKAMQNPANNQAQNALTTEALAGPDVLKKGEYRSLPKGMFFNFENPTQQLEQYKKFANVNQGGTFALAANGAAGDSMGGRSKATDLQGKYLKDRFARDSSQNYQNNISLAAQNIQGALGQAAGAKGQTDANVISALQNLYGSPALNKPGMMGSILGLAGSLGSAAIGKW